MHYTANASLVCPFPSIDIYFTMSTRWKLFLSCSSSCEFSSNGFNHFMRCTSHPVWGISCSLGLINYIPMCMAWHKGCTHFRVQRYQRISLLWEWVKSMSITYLELVQGGGMGNGHWASKLHNLIRTTNYYYTWLYLVCCIDGYGQHGYDLTSIVLTT